MKPILPIRRLFRLLSFTSLILALASCGYLQVNPPPDVRAMDDPSDQSAWLAAASNMLAAAGYGYGLDVQSRAEMIYQHMVRQFGKDSEGWTDAAIQWWLNSPANEWPENPYKLVSVIGNKKPPLPWMDPDGAAMIGNLLREDIIVCASISWPDPAEPENIQGGHVLNCWGDDRGEKKSLQPPGHLRVTDCYRNKGGIIQTYTYDKFLKERNDGSQRKGWYIDYDENQPYIKHIILLQKVSIPKGGNEALLNRVILFQENELESRAERLSIRYYSQEPPLSCNNQLIFQDSEAIAGKAIPDQSNEHEFDCEWNFSRKDLLSGKQFMILMESVGRYDDWRGISKGSLSDRQDQQRMAIPAFSWNMAGREVNQKYSSSSATGGYYIVLASFERFDTLMMHAADTFNVNMLKQYPAGINPEQPVALLTAPSGYTLLSVKAGHSYGLPTPAEQREFSSWMTNQEINHAFSSDTLAIPLNMIGLLPYAEVDNYWKRTGRQ